MSIDPTKIRPAGSRVLVKRDAHDTMTAGGLHIPERFQASPGGGSTQQLRRGRGVVVAVGPGRHRMRKKYRGDYAANGERNFELVTLEEREPLDVEIGDRVLFSILADLGDLDGCGLPELTLLDADEIIGIVESEDP